MATRKAPDKPAEKAQHATQYVVLEMKHIEPGPDEHTHARVVWRPILNQKAEEGPDGVPRIFLASNGDKAIEQYTGKDDDPDLIEGSWKAVPLRSWKSGHETRRRMTGERLPLDEGW